MDNSNSFLPGFYVLRSREDLDLHYDFVSEYLFAHGIPAVISPICFDRSPCYFFGILYFERKRDFVLFSKYCSFLPLNKVKFYYSLFSFDSVYFWNFIEFYNSMIYWDNVVKFDFEFERIDKLCKRNMILNSDIGR